MREFAEKAFYLAPPGPEASETEWKEWMDDDELKRRGHRAAHTRTLEHAAIPETAQSTIRTNGVHRQSNMLGFAGSVASGWSVEPAVEADQYNAALSSVPSKRARTRRGTRSANGAARRWANRQARRESR